MGTLLYFGKTVDLTLTTALSTITTRYATGIQVATAAAHQLLDNADTYSNPAIWHVASSMIRALCTDASYLPELEGKIRVAANFYFPNKDNKEFNNGMILAFFATINHDTASAPEAELLVLFCGCNQAVPL